MPPIFCAQVICDHPLLAIFLGKRKSFLVIPRRKERCSPLSAWPGAAPARPSSPLSLSTTFPLPILHRRRRRRRQHIALNQKTHEGNIFPHLAEKKVNSHPLIRLRKSLFLSLHERRGEKTFIFIPKISQRERGWMEMTQER